MRRRASNDSATGAAFVLIFAFVAVVSLILSILFTIAAYLVPICIIFGLITCSVLCNEKPAAEKASDLYTEQELARLNEARNKLDTLWERKQHTFSEADQLGLTPRTHDRTRFYERKPLAKRLNGRLERLESDFAQNAAEIQDLRERIQFRREKWSEIAAYWRFYSAWRLAFLVAVLGYFAAALAVCASNPVWAQQLSESVLRHIWFPVPALAAFYGGLVCASLFSALAMVLTWPAAYYYNAPLLPGEQDFNELWFSMRDRDSVDYFVGSYWTNDYSADEEAEYSSKDPDGDDDTADKRQWHEILGVSPSASVDQIKSAYREQIKLYHPDRVATLGPKLKELAEKESKALNSAYEQGLRARG